MSTLLKRVGNAASDVLSAGVDRLLLATVKGRAIAEGLVADYELNRLTTRATAAAGAKEKNAELLCVVHAREPVRAAELEEIARRRVALGAAQSEHEEREWTHQLQKMEIERVRDRFLSELCASASPAIAQFVANCRELLTQTYNCRDFVSEQTIAGGSRRLWDNAASLGVRTLAIRAGIVDAELLTVEPLDEDALLAKLEAIRESFPPVEGRPAKYR